MQCQMCDTCGRRPIAFIFPDDSVPTPDFDTLQQDTETELYYKLNFLSQIFPDRKTRVCIAQTKHELKTRFNALKYDDPNEGTLKHYVQSGIIKRQVLRNT